MVCLKYFVDQEVRIFNWIGLDNNCWVASWIGLEWIGWIGLDWIGLNWIELDWIGLDWIIGLGWIGLNWIGLDWIGLNCILDWIILVGFDAKPPPSAIDSIEVMRPSFSLILRHSIIFWSLFKRDSLYEPSLTGFQPSPRISGFMSIHYFIKSVCCISTWLSRVYLSGFTHSSNPCLFISTSFMNFCFYFFILIEWSRIRSSRNPLKKYNHRATSNEPFNFQHRIKSTTSTFIAVFLWPWG